MKTQIIFFLTFLLTGCSLFGSGGNSEKVVEGLYIMDETGLELGQWRNPPDYKIYSPPFPHPSPWGSGVYFESDGSDFLLKVEPLRENSNTISGYRKEYGREFMVDGNVYEETISIEQAGIHQINIPTKDRDGNRLPRGFYRIRLGDEYHDVFVPGPDESTREAVEYLNEIE